MPTGSATRFPRGAEVGSLLQAPSRSAKASALANPERDALEKTTRGKIERESRDQARSEREELNFALRGENLKQLRTYGQAKWHTLSNYLQSGLKNLPKLYTWFGLAILLVAVIAFLFYQQYNSPTLFFSGNSGEETNVYSYNDNTITKVTLSAVSTKNWEPAVGPAGQLYFTSDRTGKAEIYRVNDGNVQQMTHTPGSAESWSPVISGKNLYFTSNRDGSNNVYILNDSNAVKISSDESWTDTLAERYPSSP